MADRGSAARRTDATAGRHAPRPTEPASAAGHRQFVTALGRGLEVLRAFGPRDRLLGNHDIAARTGLPPATVSRLTYTLTALGYLSYQAATASYALSAGVLDLGYALLVDLDVRHVARAPMQSLSASLERSIGLAMRDRLEMVFIEFIPGATTVTVGSRIGTRSPIERTAMGLACLVASPLAEREALLRALHERAPAEWPQVRDAVQRAHESWERHGFVEAISDSPFGISAAAVPLAMPDGSAVHAFTCAGPAHAMPAAALRTLYGPRLRETVALVDAALHARHRLDAATAAPRTAGRGRRRSIP